MHNKFITALILCTLFVQPTHAATLNTKILLEGENLTVGDVFEGAENNADHVLGPAPIAGNKMILDNKTLARIADSFGVNWEGRNNTAMASVMRKTDAPMKSDSQALVSVPVLAEAISRDTIIKASDIIHMDVPAKSLNDDTALKDSDLIGKAARGLIKPNEAVSMNLLVAPKMIKRGDSVTISLRAGAISLTAKGKALADARLGEMVQVQNASSDKIVQARVTGPQEAVIEPQS